MTEPMTEPMPEPMAGSDRVGRRRCAVRWDS